MNAHTDEHVDLSAGHVLGILSESERRRRAEHVTIGCAACEGELDRFGEAALLVAHAAPLQPPPGSLRAKILSDALLASATASAGERVHDPARPLILRSGIGMGGWIAVYLIAGIIGVAIYYNLQLSKMKADQVALQHQLERVSAQMVDASRWEGAVAGPASRMVSLRPARPGAGRATVFFDAQSGRSVIAGTEMWSSAGGRLVAWGVGDGVVVPLGVLVPDRSGNALLRAEPPAGNAALRGFTISREPAAATMPPAPSEVLFQGRIE